MTLFKKTLATTQMDADGNQNARRRRREGDGGRVESDEDTVEFHGDRDDSDEDTATTVDYDAAEGVQDDRNGGDPEEKTPDCFIKW